MILLIGGGILLLLVLLIAFLPWQESPFQTMVVSQIGKDFLLGTVEGRAQLIMVDRRIPLSVNVGDVIQFRIGKRAEDICEIKLSR